MPVTIKKNDGDIKIYGSKEEPILVIYRGEQVALLNYQSVNNVKEASEISDAVMIAGIIINSSSLSESKQFKTNNIEVMYMNQVDISTHEALYSARKILHWLESDIVVTVNKRDRIRYKFTKFSYGNGKLIILYKPVAW